MFIEQAAEIMAIIIVLVVLGVCGHVAGVLTRKLLTIMGILKDSTIEKRVDDMEKKLDSMLK